MRRDFALPEQDVDYLDSCGHRWETIQEGGMWVIIYDYPVPEGYTIKLVNVALKIDAGYPVSQIDMAYFNPDLVRLDNLGIGALAIQGFMGRNWQRWSRHRTGENPWRPGLDDISTHLQMVSYWMEREIKK